jgi:DNA replication protein DnaC
MWRGLRTEKLLPIGAFGSEFTISRQQEVIDNLKADPLRGHSFFGPSGMGKSRFLHCLLQEAIEASCKHIFFSKMSALIRAMQDNEFKQLPEERWGELVNMDDVAQTPENEPYFIFIDEFDKVPITDSVYLKIFELIDFIYENQEKAKLFISSNLSLQAFIDVWGESVLRRIQVVSKVHLLWEA